MSPKTLESWTKHGGKVPDSPLLEDTFAFGLSLLEMGNLLSLKWDNYLSVGNTDEDYWKKARNKGLVQQFRTAKSLSWCFKEKRKLFMNSKCHFAIKYA